MVLKRLFFKSRSLSTIHRYLLLSRSMAKVWRKFGVGKEIRWGIFRLNRQKPLELKEQLS